MNNTSTSWSIIELSIDGNVAETFLAQLPSLLWVLLAAGIFIYLSGPIRELLPRVERFEALGMKVDVLQRQLEEAAEKMQTKIEEGQASRLVQRARRLEDVLEGASILWVDDNPGNNRPVERILRSDFGVNVRVAIDTDEAMDSLRHTDFDLVVSDMRRGAEPTAGLTLLNEMRREDFDQLFIVYSAGFDPAQGVPRGVFASTAGPENLLHYVMDALERVRT